MSQKGLAPILIVILLTVLGVGGFIFYQAKPHGKLQCDHSEGQIFSVINNNCVLTGCTQDAKICPDGSSVGRSEPKCEFAPCPTPKESTGSAKTANWETYKNSGLQYEFKYPRDYLEPQLGIGDTSFVIGYPLTGSMTGKNDNTYVLD